jgi:hypothetical protein
MGKINFIHCVCTAGGDFTWYLQKQYFPSEMLCAPDVEACIRLNSPRKRRLARIDSVVQQYRDKVKHGNNVKFLYGHTPLLENFSEIFGDDFKHIALLRDPVKRFVSQHRGSINKCNNLDEFLVWEEKFVSQELDDRNEHNGLTYNHQTEFISGFKNISATDADLADAKENLLKCSYVGIADQFDESLQLFSRIFQMPYWRFKPLKKYKAKTVLPIDTKIIDYIRERSRLDIELFDFGRNLFEKKLLEYKEFPLVLPSASDKYIMYPLRDLSLFYAKVSAKVNNRFFGTNFCY